MKWQTKLSRNQVTAVKKSSFNESISSLKTIQLKKKHQLFNSMRAETRRFYSVSPFCIELNFGGYRISSICKYYRFVNVEFTVDCCNIAFYNLILTFSTYMYLQCSIDKELIFTICCFLHLYSCVDILQGYTIQFRTHTHTVCGHFRWHFGGIGLHYHRYDCSIKSTFTQTTTKISTSKCKILTTRQFTN